MTTENKIVSDIIDKLLNGEINVVHIDGKQYEATKIDEIDDLIENGRQIKLARKYLSDLAKTYGAEIVYKKFCLGANKDNVIVSNEKLFDFNISYHAKYQFLKRFVYVYHYPVLREVVGDKMNGIFEKKWDGVLQRVLKYGEGMAIVDEFVDSLIIKFIKDSKGLTDDQIGRRRDRRAFDSRSLKYKTTSQLSCHPFLFIFQDNVLMTVELYSRAIDCRRANAITRDETEFKKWFVDNVNMEHVKEILSV